MKNYIALFSIILIIASCDIEEKPFITDYDSYINPDKKVLIEDFTGHKCPNCPDAARELDAIHNTYGDQIIGMAIHVSSFAKPSPSPFTYDFRTKWGDNWDDFFEISMAGLPRGMINRVGYQDNSHKLGKDEWATTVANELKKEINFKLSILSDSTSISVSTEVVKNINNNFNLMICLTENNIINWQKDGQHNIEDYEHNHVLRAVLLDVPLSNSSVYYQGEEIDNTININLSALEQDNIDYSINTAESGNGNAGGWVKENMNVIAYIYSTNNYEIQQVEEMRLITP